MDQETIGNLKVICDEVNPNFLNELIDMYFDQTPEFVERIKNAAGAGEDEELEAAAHRLKGSSLNLGGTRMAEVCAALEKKGRDGTLEGCEELLQALTVRYAELLAALDELRTPSRE